MIIAKVISDTLLRCGCSCIRSGNEILVPKQHVCVSVEQPIVLVDFMNMRSKLRIHQRLDLATLGVDGVCAAILQDVTQAYDDLMC